MQLERQNAVHMTSETLIVKGVPLAQLRGSFKALMQQFTTARRLRHPGQDFLHNDGNPVVDGDKKMILTGCESSAKILQNLTGIAPRHVRYPR